MIDRIAGDEGKVPYCENCEKYWFDMKGLLMHGFIGYVSKCDFKLSKEVDAAEWVPALEIKAQIFPESPGNTMHALYRMYLERNL